MGSILAETMEAETIEHLVSPVKDLFGAIFFVSVGMMVDVALIVEYLVPILCIIVAILIGQTVFSTCGFILSGQPLKTAMQCSFSLTQIGEFAFILAALGTSLGVTSDFLYPIVVAVSVFTTFTTPYMIRLAVPAYEHLNRHIPQRWRLILEHYTSSGPDVVGQENHWRSYLLQIGRVILIYGVLCIAIVALMLNIIEPIVNSWLPDMWESIVVALLTLLAIAPFLRALMMKKNHSEIFKTLWAATPYNRVPLMGVQLFRFVLGAGFVSYILGHTVHWTGALGVIVIVLVVLVMITSRALKQQSIRLEQTFTNNLNQRELAAARKAGRPQFAGHLVERDIHLSDFQIPIGISWAGHTLAKLNLGRRYGIHVVSILRGRQRLNIPSGNTAILPGDRLQVIGTDQQLAAFGHELEVQNAVLQTMEPSKEEMKLRRLVIESGSRFVGQTIQQSAIRQDFRCLIVGLEQGDSESLVSPNPQRSFQSGDVVWVVGEEADLSALEQAGHSLGRKN